MACPMRFVLVGVSLVVALVLAWFTFEEGGEEQRREDNGKPGRHGASLPKRRSKVELPSWRQGAWLLLDMFTGKYLYQIVRGGAAS
ncbi:unnamed protein product, partial [Ostreobium quekettii]